MSTSFVLEWGLLVESGLLRTGSGLEELILLGGEPVFRRVVHLLVDHFLISTHFGSLESTTDFTIGTCEGTQVDRCLLVVLLISFKWHQSVAFGVYQGSTVIVETLSVEDFLGRIT